MAKAGYSAGETVFWRAGISFAFLIVATDASAQSVIDDKYWLQVSGYRPQVDSDVRIGRPGTSVGTEIDFEDDLDLNDRETLPAIFVGVRPGEKWRIGFDYYRLSRSGETVLGRDIVVDDVTYPVSASLNSRFASDIYRLTVGYSFVKQDNVEAGVAIGAHMTDFETIFRGTGTVGEQSASTEVRRRELLAPLPTLGVYAAYEPAPRLTLEGRADYLSLKIGDYDGSLLNAQASLVYRFTDNVGIGAMYRYVRYRLDVEKDNWEGGIGYRFHGPALFLEVGF